MVTADVAHWRIREDVGEWERRIECEGINIKRIGYTTPFLGRAGMGSGIEVLACKIADRANRWMNWEPGRIWIKRTAHLLSSFEKEDFDLVMATGGPFESFVAASKIARRLGVPYVLDYRDFWSSNPHLNWRDSRDLMDTERATARDASAIITVSKSLAETVRAVTGESEKIHVITNGYDPEETKAVAPATSSNGGMVYAGLFYPPKRVVGPVFAAMRKVLNGGEVGAERCKFHYYGDHIDHVRESAQRYGVSDQVIIYGNRPRHEVLAAAKGANLNIVITTSRPKAGLSEKGMITGKIFELLGLRRPILLIAPEGADAEEVLGDCGVRCTGDDIEGIAGAMTRYLKDRADDNPVTQDYAWPNIAGRMAEVLNRVVG